MIIKKIFVIGILFIILSFQTVAQNQSPQVTNVTFTQRTDESLIVDIYYDVNDPDGDVMTITMQVSDDNGATWNFTCSQLSGAFGSGITSGTQKHIEWDFGTEHAQTFGDQFRIKIIADDSGFNTGIPCPDEPTVLYEGVTYHTVLIGTQCWLRENLNVGTRIDGSQEQTNNVPTNFIEKYCYDNLEANCTTYGGLYQWNEAMQYVANEGAQGICPLGWHLPRLSEIDTLGVTINWNGNELKREDQGIFLGQGTNTSGFSALLAGARGGSGIFDNLGYFTYFWSSMGDAPWAFSTYLTNHSSTFTGGFFSMDYGFSVRCLKD